MDNIERRESGPAYFDKASDASEKQSTMAADFLSATDKGDASAMAPWAPLAIKWTGTAAIKRVRTLAECMSESLDYGKGPKMAEAMQLLLDVANGSDESTTAKARRLLERMAESFAYFNED
jgi:hypothetical protein